MGSRNTSRNDCAIPSSISVPVVKNFAFPWKTGFESSPAWSRSARAIPSRSYDSRTARFSRIATLTAASSESGLASSAALAGSSAVSPAAAEDAGSERPARRAASEATRLASAATASR
jgi:hypothetical protein